MLTTSLLCSCGYEAPDDEALPFRCPNSGSGDVDHVLRRELVAGGDADELRQIFLSDEPNPFVRYRALLHSYTVARRRGMPDEAYVALVRNLDTAVQKVAGTGFRETLFAENAALNKSLGRGTGALWIKDETGNVSGSHKARHLFGVLLWIEVARVTQLLEKRPVALAIASCGNAALGAAVVARAARIPLDVFVPPDAHPVVVENLQSLGARVTSCPRDLSIAGDPCMHAFRARVAEGAVPFGVQGNENGLALEGGLTLGYEIVSALLRENRALDRIFIQVGGGALASSCIQALQDARALDLLPRLPRIHPVQTTGAYPLYRAWDRVVHHVTGQEAPHDFPPSAGDSEEDDLCAAALLREPPEWRRDAMQVAATHRSDFMWPWEAVPKSVAHGILDDETYDWLAIVRGTIESGGFPVVVSEKDLAAANRLTNGVAVIDADETGTSGLAGCIKLAREGIVRDEESVGVLVTGVRR
ncbi:MAG: pyridoxal-phosphate dependent enzyme [Thermoanaerobaculia bacterium]